jgi:hypothetical protein
MQFIRLSIILLLILTAGGCCWVVARSGDAKIIRCRELIHQRGSKSYRMELPKVSIAQAGTNILEVRDLPPYLTGLFNYDLSMIVPDDEEALMSAPCSKTHKNPPWQDVKISIAFRKLDGVEVFKKTLILGTTSHSAEGVPAGWRVGWNLGAGSYDLDPVPIEDDSFDIVVVVEQPSKRASDKINISAWTVYPKP